MNSYTFSKKQLFYLFFKRILDILFALFLTITFLPFFLLISLLVILSSPGPIIFKQIRTGYKKIPFKIYKFRTMKTEIQIDGKPLTDKERLTKIGFFLRKFSLDELPQVFNVILGQMSFIGPRPFLINDLNTYTLEEEIRFLLKPGISSWTGVNGRNSLSIKKKYSLEIFYVKNISLWLDIKIFFKTILVVVRGKNIDDNINKKRIAAEIRER